MLILKIGPSKVSFNLLTGEFRWADCCKKPWMNGQLATRERPNGYLYMKIGQKQYSASRLAWQLYNSQPIPVGLVIDHINKNKADNRRENLRAITQQANVVTHARPSPNRTGYAKLASEACDK